MPKLIEFHAETGVLITLGLDGYAPLAHKLSSRGALDPDVSVAAALALVCIHRQRTDLACLENMPFPLPFGRPMTPEEYCGQAAEYPLFAASVGRVETVLRSLAEEWRPAFFIHGDFKTENILLNADPRAADRPKIVVVDWELAGRGEPLWDVGSYVGSLLFGWIDGLQYDTGVSPARDALTAIPFQRQIGHFLITYRHLAPEKAGKMEQFVLSGLRFAGIFFMHRALASLAATGRVGAAGLLMLAMGETLLNQTEHAAAVLLPGLQ